MLLSAGGPRGDTVGELAVEEDFEPPSSSELEPAVRLREQPAVRATRVVVAVDGMLTNSGMSIVFSLASV